MREEWARYERVVATPTSMTIAFDVHNSVDVRDLLAQVTQPTLVIHSTRNVLAPVAHGRYLATHTGEILASQTIRDALFGSAFELTSRGLHTLKGVPGEWHVYAVAN
jgi:hypothetical protein